MIGYLLEQGLRTRSRAVPSRRVLTQVVVDRGDPAFLRPTKPIGPIYSSARRGPPSGCRARLDGGGRRCCVPSRCRVARAARDRRARDDPRLLVESGVVVVCAGGGGIPVARDETGALAGVEAVIDKDLSAALLAEELAGGVLVLADGRFGRRARVGDRLARADATPRRCSSARGSPRRARWARRSRPPAGSSTRRARAAIGALGAIDALVDTGGARARVTVPERVSTGGGSVVQENAACAN